MNKIIKTGQEAREALKKGIDKTVDCAKATLGKSGRNAVLGRIDIPPTITNDAVSIVRNVELDDECENQGAWIVKEACSVTSKNAKDGTTTTAVLLQAIIKEVFDQMKDDGSLITKKFDVMQSQRDIDLACEKVVKALEDIATPISTREEIYNVALGSGEFEWLAQMVTDIYLQIGKDGYVDIVEGIKSKFEVFKGIELSAGYHSEYFINNDNQECVIELPHILVTNQPLDTNSVIELIAHLIEQKSNGLLIVAPDFSKDLLNRMNTTKLKFGFNAIGLKLQTYDKDDVLKDIASITNAKFLDKNLYTKIENFVVDITVENLGRCDKAIIGDSKTILMGGTGNTTERIAELKNKIEQTSSVFDKDTLEKRLAFMSGGIATLTIGGESDFEKGYFKLKAHNAVGSVENALKFGVVKGAGLALKEISEELPINILSNALKAPYDQIQANNGQPFDIPDTVIDPVKVTTSALKSACSLAGRVITTEVLIAFKNKDGDKD